MLVPSNLYEVVFRSEMEDYEKSIADAYLGVNNVYRRLKQQKAPAELVERLFDLRVSLEKDLKDVRELRDCFPVDPRQPL